ncbi:phage contractile tail tube protein, P2 family [Cohaesibacter sp. ES.047]|uniref:phage major tail tube protein n=1 Tax=Cohaesibacter sp. ES.047 TaxID=1798205 RepID=UPI000BB8A0B9|nr:phage major tail tube protein [Cohaesibacter sp. ES.047]SNY91404.1 phage contractile tail tube protein, P2 family [Cohaesibacter sp. ES.047]
MAMEKISALDGFTLWIGDADYGGTVTGITLPGLPRRIEGRRTGGRRGVLGVKLGLEEAKATIKTKGVSQSLIDAVSSGKIDGTRLFARGNLDDQQGGYTSVVYELQGRCTNPDKISEEWTDDDVEGELEFWLVYWRKDVAGERKLEVDLLNDTIYPDEANDARRANLGR